MVLLIEYKIIHEYHVVKNNNNNNKKTKTKTTTVRKVCSEVLFC